MRLALCGLVVLASACAPSRAALFGPVDREIERRLGLRATMTASADGRVSGAVATMLQKPLDRDAAVRIALANNRRLQAEYERLGVAGAAIAAATVLAPAEVDIEYKFEKDGTTSGGEIELDVIQDVLGLLQLPQRRGAANAELAAARARATATTIELVARVELAFFDQVAAVQQLELRQTAFDSANASALIAERMHAAGNLPDLGLARERAQRERTRIELARAQTDVELTREELNAELGLSGKDTAWTAEVRLPDVPEQAPALDTLERDAVAASLDIAAVRAEAEAAARRLGIARVRTVLPSLGVGAAADRIEGEWDIGPAVRVGIPLFNQQQAARARANADLRRARNEAIATAVELRARVRATRQRVLQAHAEARHVLTAILPLQQRVLQETVKQYNAMNASTFELLVARRDLVEAGERYIDALRRYWRAEAAARALARGAMPRLEESREPVEGSGGIEDEEERGQP